MMELVPNREPLDVCVSFSLLQDLALHDISEDDSGLLLCFS